MTATLKLVCPIRGELKTPARSADGLKPSEEARRIEAIRFLIGKGYPADQIKVEATIKRFGHGGRNSFRADLIALDVPIATIDRSNIDELLEHAVLLGEVKREHKSAASATETQVKPMLDFAHHDECVALYWDDTEQRIFWRERKGKRRVEHDAPATLLPEYGHKVAVKSLTLADTIPSESLIDAFKRIENLLHAAAIDPEARYGVILQLLLAKLYDEHSHANEPTAPLALQDYRALGASAEVAQKSVNKVLKKAANYYGQYLPRPVEPKLPVGGDTLLEIMEVLAPLQITASSQSVIQTFYMHFAKHLYKWDLAQFFTPVSISDFIATILAPRFGEHIKDPACGSADFLSSAYRLGVRVDPNYSTCVWGADNSANAVQVAVLNMLLNGDGKSNILREDSLENVERYENQFDMVICNPPFGTRILETRKDVLKKFALGYEWSRSSDGSLVKRADLRKKQQVGLLFAELCVRQAKPGGRVAIILPNGYLGNKSTIYLALREWLLRHCRIASICSFPRFTFKTSGADVSASVLFLEKRKRPVAKATSNAAYPCHIGMIESVGWQLGDSGAKPVYQRDPADGSYIVDSDGNRILYADFDRVIEEIRSSDAASRFKWLAQGAQKSTKKGWSISASEIVREPTLCLDPKRLCEKTVSLRRAIDESSHVSLGDIVDFLPQSTTQRNASRSYRYVELEDMAAGGYRWKSLRGWQLPDRARHDAKVGDIFIGSVWGSVQKWMMVGGDDADLIVTNGCHRIRLKRNMEKYRLDLIAALATEAYATQMRAFARGSDGLAEVAADDAAAVLIPLVSKRAARSALKPFVDQLLTGYTHVGARLEDLVEAGELDIPIPASRPSHSVLV